MKLTRTEKERNRQAFRSMSFSQRLDYVLTYYKPALLALGLAVIVGIAGVRRLTERPTDLYVGLINVTVGQELHAELTEPGEITLYEGLYLTDDADNAVYQYVYASRMKLLSSIEAQQLDVVLVNREGYDALSQSGYLADLSSLISEDSPLAHRLVSNLVILEDNAREHALDESVPYRAETAEAVNGLDCTDAPLFQRSGMDDAVYLAVIANSPRAEQALAYCAGLCAAGPEDM